MKNSIIKPQLFTIVLFFISVQPFFAQAKTDATIPSPSSTKTETVNHIVEKKIDFSISETIKAIGSVMPKRPILKPSKTPCNVSVCFQNNSSATIEIVLTDKQETFKNKIIIQPKGEGCFYDDVKIDVVYKYSAFDNANKTLKTESQIRMTCEQLKITIQ